MGELASGTTDPRCISVETVVTGQPESPPAPLLFHLRGVFFEPGSAVIDRDRGYWLRVAAALNEPGVSRYVIDGHADTAGSADYNLDLSEKRVLAAAEFLARKGVAWDQIEMSHHGEMRPMRATADGVSEALNRRVWIDMRSRAARSD